MTWYVKARDGAVGKVATTICDTPAQVLDHAKNQRNRGRTVWIEDADGRLVDEATLAAKAARN